MNRGCHLCRTGSVYLLALLVTLVVAGIAMVMARGAAVRLHLHQQEHAQAQCRAAALGFLRAVTADLNASIAVGGSPHLTTVEPAGETIGDCTVVLLGRDPAGRQAQFGLIGMAGRIGVNSLADATVPAPIRAGLANALLNQPGITLAMVAALRDWTDADDVPDADGGAERTDGAYLGAPVPYAPRNAPMLGLEEVRLVRDLTDALYFGGDVNQNGRLDAGEAVGEDGGVALGLRDVLGLESREPAAAVDHSISITTGWPQNRALTDKLTALFGTTRGGELDRAIREAFPGQPPVNRLQLFCALADVLSDDEADLLWPALIGPERRIGLIDPWACPDPVLAGLVGSELAQVLGKSRPTTPPTGPGWLMRTLTRAQAIQYGSFLTSGSYQFRADILAVRNDGAGWVRLEAGIDCASGAALVTGIREADRLGWPLPWCPPDVLRRRAADQDPIALLTTAND